MRTPHLVNTNIYLKRLSYRKTWIKFKKKTSNFMTSLLQNEEILLVLHKFLPKIADSNEPSYCWRLRVHFLMRFYQFLCTSIWIHCIRSKYHYPQWSMYKMINEKLFFFSHHKEMEALQHILKRIKFRLPFWLCYFFSSCLLLWTERYIWEKI